MTNSGDCRSSWFTAPQDQVIPIQDGREMRDFLQTVPVDLTWKEYDMGHWVTPQSMSDISNWLKNQLDKLS